MGNAGKDGLLPDVISGHGAGAHCAIVALPFAGDPQSDGRIMGFGIVFPRDVSVGDRRRVIGASGVLERRGIYLGRSLGNWLVKLELSAAQVSLRESTWARGSKSWSSVTPILLDRFAKKNGPSVEDILVEACSRIGLPEPCYIEHGPYSPLPGVPPVPQFRLQRKRGERPRWGVHAQIEFPVEVVGPVILGAGRFFGLGLMRPQRKPEGESGND
jgi:CRISPR-associated protein Csb2